MAVADILNEIDRLPWSERMVIVDHILDDLPPPPDAPTEGEAVAIASQRIEELRSGKVKGLTLEEHLANVQAMMVRQ